MANKPESASKEAYCTLLLTDDYVPGAIVVATQLRTLDTTRSIVCLIAHPTEGTLVSKHSIRLLENVFDKLVFVDPIDVGDSPELRLLGRPELRMATTKLRLWELPYSKVVYLDADTLPVKSLQTLFDTFLPSTRQIGASPDCGWPDMFNSGVLVLRPDPNLAQDIIEKASSMSLTDGSDQGLLNQEFDWVRLPFLYNVTANASYEYAPAYAKFEKDVKVLHFIGSQKPWAQTQSESPIVKQWWSVYKTTSLGKMSDKPYEQETEFNPEKVIAAPPDFWDARSHAPFRNSRPEGEFLAQRLASLKVIEEEPAPPLPNKPPTPSKLEEYVPPLPQTVPSPPRTPMHIFPVYGPSLVCFPFEAKLGTPEREF